MASLSAVYNGSSSIRAGTWLLLDAFGTLATDALIDLGGRIGVVEMVEGLWLKAAGSMSGILESRLERPCRATCATITGP